VENIRTPDSCEIFKTMAAFGRKPDYFVAANNAAVCRPAPTKSWQFSIA
jgi:hypothetical protein